MKKYLPVIAALLACFSLTAQPYHGHFLKKVKSTGYGPASFTCVAYDKRGNLYAAGSFKDTVTFDNGTRLFSNNGSEDIVIAKFDRKGKTIWAKKAGSLHDIETAHDIAVDSYNNVYVVGFAQGKAKFDNTIINIDTAAGEHGFLAKLDSNGAYQWVKGGIAFEYNAYTAKQTSLYVDKNNNLFFGGSITNQVTNLPRFNGVNFTNIDCCNSNLFLWKMNGAGTILARFEPARSFDYITGITGDSKGNIIVVGAYTSSDSTNAGALQIVKGTPIRNAKGSFSSAYNSGYTLKLDNNLKPLWIKPNWGTASSVLTGVAVDSLDNIYVGGTYGDTLQIGTTKLITGEHSNNIYYAKYNAAGTFQWSKSYGAFTEYGYNAYRLAYDKANDKLWATIHTNMYPIIFSSITINHNLAICEINKPNGKIINLVQNTTDPDVKAIGLSVWNKNVVVVGSYVTGFPGQDTSVTILGQHAPISYNEPEDGFIFEFTDTTTILPVNLSAVKAYLKAAHVYIEFTAQSEIGIDKYEIEKSNNGTTYTKIATLKALNQTKAVTYQTQDSVPFTGLNYYRIKIISKDGSTQYSPFVSVTTNKTAGAVKLYPNPVALGGSVNLQLSNLEKESYALQIVNYQGQKFTLQNIEYLGGSTIQRVALPQQFVAGTCFLQLTNGKNSNFSQQLIVQ